MDLMNVNVKYPNYKRAHTEKNILQQLNVKQHNLLKVNLYRGQSMALSGTYHTDPEGVIIEAIDETCYLDVYLHERGGVVVKKLTKPEVRDLYLVDDYQNAEEYVSSLNSNERVVCHLDSYTREKNLLMHGDGNFLSKEECRKLIQNIAANAEKKLLEKNITAIDIKDMLIADINEVKEYVSINFKSGKELIHEINLAAIDYLRNISLNTKGELVKSEILATFKITEEFLKDYKFVKGYKNSSPYSLEEQILNIGDYITLDDKKDIVITPESEATKELINAANEDDDKFKKLISDKCYNLSDPVKSYGTFQLIADDIRRESQLSGPIINGLYVTPSCRKEEYMYYPKYLRCKSMDGIELIRDGIDNYVSIENGFVSIDKHGHISCYSQFDNVPYELRGIHHINGDIEELVMSEIYDSCPVARKNSKWRQSLEENEVFLARKKDTAIITILENPYSDHQVNLPMWCIKMVGEEKNLGRIDYDGCIKMVPNEVGVLVYEDDGSSRYYEMERAKQLYGDALDTLPINVMDNIEPSIFNLRFLKKHEVEHADVEMYQMPKDSGHCRFTSKDYKGEEFEFSVDGGDYVASYGNGQLFPIKEADANRNYVRSPQTLGSILKEMQNKLQKNEKGSNSEKLEKEESPIEKTADIINKLPDIGQAETTTSDIGNIKNIKSKKTTKHKKGDWGIE